MASIWWEEPVEAPAEATWAALRRADAAHHLFAPVLVDAAMAGDIRTVTFANGLVARERIINIDEQRQRISYAVLGDLFDYHSASMQIVPVDAQRCRLVWISDFLPAEREETVRPLVKQGAQAFARNVESGKVGSEDVPRP